MMKVDEGATHAARERHAQGVRVLHGIFMYDPSTPRRPRQWGGQPPSRRSRRKKKSSS